MRREELRKVKQKEEEEEEEEEQGVRGAWRGRKSVGE
jgi:hypothetical protein